MKMERHQLAISMLNNERGKLLASQTKLENEVYRLERSFPRRRNSIQEVWQLEVSFRREKARLLRDEVLEMEKQLEAIELSIRALEQA